MKQTLLSHLVFRISGNQTENLATEALCYILNRSVTANKAFIQLISQKTGLKIPIVLKFNTQDASGQDDSIPDMTGLDANGNQVLLVESKFWAGLTNHQPVTYLKRLSDKPDSILVFVSPSRRFVTLWPELKHRCKEAGLIPQLPESEDDEFKHVTIDKYPMLALTSWRMVLNLMRHAVETEGDTDTLSDIMQLQGLCDRMDATAFLPLQSEELTSNVGKRIDQYCDLVDTITEQLANEGVANLKGFRATPQRYGYARYMAIHDHGCSFQINFIRWRNFRETPLWFVIYNWSVVTKERLVKLAMEDPPRLIQDGNELTVPIFIPIGVERDEVIKSVIGQIHEITDILATVNG